MTATVVAARPTAFLLPHPVAAMAAAVAAACSLVFSLPPRVTTMAAAVAAGASPARSAPPDRLFRGLGRGARLAFWLPSHPWCQDGVYGNDGRLTRLRFPSYRPKAGSRGGGGRLAAYGAPALSHNTAETAAAATSPLFSPRPPVARRMAAVCARASAARSGHPSAARMAAAVAAAAKPFMGRPRCRTRRQRRMRPPPRRQASHASAST